MKSELRTNCPSSLVHRRSSGFSLLEALIATGILGMGLILIAMVFPVGVKLTALASDRTFGVIAANEAFAKIHLYGLPGFSTWPVSNPAVFPHVECTPYKALLELKYAPMTAAQWDTLQNEFLYPSLDGLSGQERMIHWSALCRAIDALQVQTMVFVTRRAAEGMRYYSWDYDLLTNTFSLSNTAAWPSPVPVLLRYEGNPKQMKVVSYGTAAWGPAWNDLIFGLFGDGVTLVENRTGAIYPVLEYTSSSGGQKDTLILKEIWKWPGYELDPANPPAGPLDVEFWVVPPAVGSTRDPVIGVSQTVIILSP